VQAPSSLFMVHTRSLAMEPIIKKLNFHHCFAGFLLLLSSIEKNWTSCFEPKITLNSFSRDSGPPLNQILTCSRSATVTSTKIIYNTIRSFKQRTKSNNVCPYFLVPDTTSRKVAGTPIVEKTQNGICFSGRKEAD